MVTRQNPVNNYHRVVQLSRSERMNIPMTFQNYTVQRFQIYKCQADVSDREIHVSDLCYL
jgi:hypothetical protein